MTKQTPAALIERATLAADILRDLERLQARGLTAPRSITGWLVTRLHADLVALAAGWPEPPAEEGRSQTT